MRLVLGCAVALAAAAPIAASADDVMEKGRALFTAGAIPPCAICHTLADAGSAGEVGPNLNTLAPDKSQVAAAVAGGIGVMPAYGDTLSADEIEALAVYVSTAVNF